MPTSLREVVRQKDRGDIRLVTDAEIATLTVPMPAVTHMKAHVEDWTLLHLSLARQPKAAILLMGHRTTDGQYVCTSPVVGIHDRLVFTRSGSTYCCDGEPKLEPYLPALCAVLNELGVGADLGVAPLFF
jgi:hypothetical protein